MIRITVSFVALVLLATPAAGQTIFFADQLRKVRAVYVFIGQSGEDRCLPQPHLLKVEAELVLRRSGITVLVKDDGAPHRLWIGVTGRELPSGGCAATLDCQLYRFEYLNDRSMGRVQAFAAGELRIDPKVGFQQHLRETVNEIVTELANEIVKARQK